MEGMHSRAIVMRERVSLAWLLLLSLLGTVAEAGFLVLITRSALALGNGEGHVAVTGAIDLDPGTALLAAGGLALVRLVANLAGAAVTSRSLARAAIHLRTTFTDGYLASSWATKQSLAPGRVQQLLSSYTQTAVTVVTAVARGITAMVSLAALISVAVLVQPVMTLLAGGLVVLLATLMLPLRRAVRRQSQIAADTQLDYAGRVNETEALALEIEVLGVAGPTADRVREAAVDAARSLGRSQFAQLTIGPTYQFVAYGAVLVLLAASLGTGLDDVATTGVVVVLLLRALSYGQSLQVAQAQYTNADVYARSLDDELGRLRAGTATRGRTEPTDRSGIAATHLDFAYDRDATLHDMTFSITPGEIIGVVGPSGSGKSTLSQLLLGLRPSAGRLTFDDVAVDAIDPAWWSRNVALVPQHAELLTGTVAENVRFLRPEISSAAIEAACRAAAIHDDVVALPEGYDTHLGERGSRLSGGQRQRLCLARALAGSPRFLVLDEPTSALDGEAERRVLEALHGLDPRPTIVLVTHRPAALDICNRVMRLDSGRIEYLGPVEGHAATPR